MFGRGKKPVKGQQKIARSFNHAYRGLVYAVRTQRNMRFHVVVAVVVLVLSLLVGVSKLELAILVLASARLWNQFAFRHSSLSRPLKLSMCPFCIGLPVWM